MNKRTKIRPGKFVFISLEVREKVALAAATCGLSRDEALGIAAAEPRGATAYAGRSRPSRRLIPFSIRVRERRQRVAIDRLVARVRKLIDGSGASPSNFDVEAWVCEWMHQPLPQLAGKTPAQTVETPDGLSMVEAVLDAMAGGILA